MEKSPSSTIEKQRKWMRDQIYFQIAEIKGHEDLYRQMRNIFAHYGLTVWDVGKDFLVSRDWSDTSKRKEHLEMIKEFLKENIK